MIMYVLGYVENVYKIAFVLEPLFYNVKIYQKNNNLVPIGTKSIKGIYIIININALLIKMLIMFIYKFNIRLKVLYLKQISAKLY